MTTTGADNWQAWQESWDRQQEWHLPDREERFQAMLDMVEATVGTAPRVLDLASGTGTITDRVLRRFPKARCVGVDLDPALLTIARGYFASEDRTEIVTADLTDPDWPALLPQQEFDAVLTATALHWLRAQPLVRLYQQVAHLTRFGGVFLNADHMPDESTPRINEAEQRFRNAHQERQRAEGTHDWHSWWQLAAADPTLAEPVARHYEIYGAHADGESLSPLWHTEALREAGFEEARVVWRSAPDAIVTALR